MKVKIAKKWLSALRSGDYIKGVNFLHIREKGVDKYCCLGVLCELAKADGVLLKEKEDEDNRIFTTVCYDSQDAFLPESVIEWAGLRTHSGELPFIKDEDDDPDESLTSINDETESFEEVIQAIEANIKEL